MRKRLRTHTHTHTSFQLHTTGKVIFLKSLGRSHFSLKSTPCCQQPTRQGPTTKPLLSPLLFWSPLHFSLKSLYRPSSKQAGLLIIAQTDQMQSHFNAFALECALPPGHHPPSGILPFPPNASSTQTHSDHSSPEEFPCL